MTCAKVVVQCFIITRDNQVFEGTNCCDNPQEQCPRLPGEDYTKCREICRQPSHAEVAAVNSAKEAGADLRGAHAELRGLHYVCKPCATVLKDAGIATILIHTSS